MDKRGRAWRRAQLARVFKARMEVCVNAYGMEAWNSDGSINKHPYWYELATNRYAKVYKSTGTPCSCMLCKGERYNRREAKKDALRVLNESLDME